MPNDAALLRKARAQQQQDAREHQSANHLRREALIKKAPRLGELDNQIRTRFLAALQQMTPEAMKQAEQDIHALQTEQKALLSQLGASAGIYEGAPLCLYCKDSGLCPDGICRCVMERYRLLQNRELSSLLHLEHQNFDTFNPDLYSEQIDPGWGGSPREQIELIYEVCVNFSRRFGHRSDNLIFSGPPGTGKTFLSSCVAGAVSERGFSVVYDTAIHQLQLMEQLHFGRGVEETESAVCRMLQCDLLIMDDLGTEFLSPFAHSALMDIINSRLMEHKTMLVSTNLTDYELRERYKGALASRLEGEFIWLSFYGDDLRKKTQK